MLRKPGSEIGAKARGNSGTERQATGQSAAGNGRTAAVAWSGRQRGKQQ
ncbi:MAG: hypothetical protein HFH90_13475 [Lachnospiraceae bacterium]|nr:hypothetical protein [Lachnospiraceae bacterium]